MENPSEMKNPKTTNVLSGVSDSQTFYSAVNVEPGELLPHLTLLICDNILKISISLLADQ